MKNQLMMFEKTKVNMAVVNNELIFELYSTGMALGQVKHSKGISYPRKDRIDENVKNAEINPVVHNGQLWITESQLYELMLEVKTDRVRPFRKWLTKEVLPSIRKTGKYELNQPKQLEIQEYEYFDKTWNGKPILTLRDLEHFTGISSHTMAYYLKKPGLFIKGTDYELLEGSKLAIFKKENPRISRLISSLIIITKSGFDKMAKILSTVPTVPECFRLQKAPAPESGTILANETLQELIIRMQDNLGGLKQMLARMNRPHTDEEYRQYQDAVKEIASNINQDAGILNKASIQSKIKILDLSEADQRKRETLFKKVNERYGIDCKDRSDIKGWAFDFGVADGTQYFVTA